MFETRKTGMERAEEFVSANADILPEILSRCAGEMARHRKLIDAKHDLRMVNLIHDLVCIIGMDRKPHKSIIRGIAERTIPYIYKEETSTSVASRRFYDKYIKEPNQ